MALAYYRRADDALAVQQDTAQARVTELERYTASLPDLDARRDQLRWLFAHYGEQYVADWVRQHGFRLLSKRSFALWRLALGVVDYVAPEWAVEAKEMSIW